VVNWEAIAAIGEVVGAAGVIASLIYLAVQIRQNTAALRAANLRDVVNAIASRFDRMTADPTDRELYMRGVGSLASLAPGELERFWVLVAGVSSNIELVRDLHRDRLIKVATYEASIMNLATLLSNPGVREIWEQRKSVFAQDFRTFVDSRIASRGPAA
jgi:hypothetical protein